MKTITLLLVSWLLLISNSFGQTGNLNNHYDLESICNERSVKSNLIKTDNDSLITDVTSDFTISFPLESMFLDSVIAYRFIQQDDSMAVIRTTYFYDEVNNTLLHIFLYRTVNDPVWKNYSKYFSTFNNDNLLIQRIGYLGDGQNWIKIGKWIYEYDSNNEWALTIDYTWDS